AVASQSGWSSSVDGTCRFPNEVLEGLNSMTWRRIVCEVHERPLTGNTHVFLIAKKSEQWAQEHEMSRECIRCLAEALDD
ncbi:unnamed protein product, partial [Polarella glacialis]